MSSRLRTVLLTVLPTAAVLTAVAAQAGGSGPPTVRGRLTLSQQRCAQIAGGRSVCTYDYVLDPSTTNDPGDEWHAFWTATEAAAPARRGYCTTEVADELDWGTSARAAQMAPPGAATVGPGVSAQLPVDAAGNARVPASLEQSPAWPRGLVTTTAAPGKLSIRWEGATTRAVSLAYGAEVVNPHADSLLDFGGTQYDVGLPCAHIGPPGPGFLARIRPMVSRPGKAAYLQVRIPGTHLTPGGYRSGTAKVVIGAGRPTVLSVVGRSGLALPARRDGLYPGRYVIRVTLHGPSGTRRYRLPLRVR